MEDLGKKLPLEKVWLVKSGRKVMGPFDATEVSELIRKGELIAIDEVAQPTKRWRYLRDLSEFSAALEARRSDRSFVNEDTVNIVGEEEVDASFDDRVETPDSPQNVVTEAAKVYGYSKDKRVRAQMNSFSRTLWYACALVGLMVFGFAIYRSWVLPKAKVAQVESSSLSQADQLYETGDYEQAFSLYKKLADKHQTDSLFVMRYVPLLLQFKGESVLARRLIEQAREDLPAEVSKLLTGMSYLVEGDKDAAIASFDFVLKLEEQSYPALFGKALAFYNKGDYHLANALLEKTSYPEPDGLRELLFFFTNLKLKSKEKAPETISLMRSRLETYLAQSYDYRNEVMTALIYLAYSLEKATPKQLISSFLDSDPYLTAEHIHDPLLLRTGIGWQELWPLCDSIKGASSDSQHLMFIAFCAIKADKMDVARSLTQAAVRQSPKDPLVQVSSSVIYGLQGLDDEAQISLERAMKAPGASEYKQPFVLKARQCEARQDYECAASNWQKVLSINSKYPSALMGYGRTQMRLGRREEVKKVLGLMSSTSNYRPFFKLRNEFSGTQEE